VHDIQHGQIIVSVARGGQSTSSRRTGRRRMGAFRVCSSYIRRGKSRAAAGGKRQPISLSLITPPSRAPCDTGCSTERLDCHRHQFCMPRSAPLLLEPPPHPVLPHFDQPPCSSDPRSYAGHSRVCKTRTSGENVGRFLPSSQFTVRAARAPACALDAWSTGRRSREVSRRAQAPSCVPPRRPIVSRSRSMAPLFYRRYAPTPNSAAWRRASI
jgi:hypothetical protein